MTLEDCQESFGNFDWLPAECPFRSVTEIKTRRSLPTPDNPKQSLYCCHRKRKTKRAKAFSWLAESVYRAHRGLMATFNTPSRWLANKSYAGIRVRSPISHISNTFSIPHHN